MSMSKILAHTGALTSLTVVYALLKATIETIFDELDANSREQQRHYLTAGNGHTGANSREQQRHYLMAGHGHTESKDRKETAKDLESKIDKDFQDIQNKMEGLLKEFKNLAESKKNEVRLHIAELEKNQGMMKEKKSAEALESMLKRKVRQLSRRIQCLEKDVQDLPETIKLELQVHRGALENIKEIKEEDIASALEKLFKKNIQECTQKIDTLQEDIEECEETIKKELQIFRDQLDEKRQEMKEGEDALAQKEKLKENIQELSQTIESLKEDIKECQETINTELWIFRDEMDDKSHGMMKVKKRAWALESRLKRKVRQLSRRIQSLENDVEDLPETIMLELQVRRGALKNIKGMKEGDISLALEILFKKNIQEFSQKIDNLRDDIEECQDTINQEIEFLQDELDEKSQGNK